jgi:DNA-binding NtrC family response regulator
MTNALDLSVSEVIEMYSLRWQIELFFKELKSTFGFAQYSLEKFPAVEAWTEIVIMTGMASLDSAVVALRKGVFDFLRKPFEPAESRLPGYADRHCQPQQWGNLNS